MNNAANSSSRTPTRRRSGRALATTTAALLSAMLSVAVPIVEASAQSAPPPPRTPQGGDGRFKHMGIGVAVGGLLSVGYYFMSERGTRSGKCGPWNCAMPYLTVSGGIAGLFMSKELAAQRRAERPRVGDALEFASVEYLLPAAPTSLGLRDTLLAVATDSGAQVMSTVARSAALRRRGAGLSDVRWVAISGGDPRLFIGTGSALWETPPTTGLLSRVLDGPVDALSAAGDIVVAASGPMLRIRRGEGTTARVDTVNAPAAVTSATFDPQTQKFWITTDSLILELTVGEGAPALQQRAVVSGNARAIATSSTTIAAALGSDGVAIWPREALTGGGGVTTPVLLRGEPRFAFDLAFLGQDLYVAGGVDGITRIELSPTARIVGSSRQAQYATSIVSDGTALWVGDRNTSRTRIIRITP